MTQHGAQGGNNHTFGGQRRWFALAFLGLLLLPAAKGIRADSWTGLSPSTDNWSDPLNWLDGTIPLIADSVTFDALDSGNTNVVDTDFTIGGLTYRGNGLHTTDFADGSSLQIDGPVHIGYGGTGSSGNVSWTNGGLVTIGSDTSAQELAVGQNTVSNANTTGSLVMSDVTVVAHLDQLNVGRKTSWWGGSAQGSLNIAGTSSALFTGVPDIPLTLIPQRDLVMVHPVCRTSVFEHRSQAF